MTYQEEEKTRLRRQSSRQAIGLAMEGLWREAVAANKKLLETFPNDSDAYNRLGRAYMELGEYPQARVAYEKALEVDQYNVIAKKNLARLSHLGESAVSGGTLHKVEPQQFIEEVGKAGVASLNKLAPPAVLARVVAGDTVNLKIQSHALMAENPQGEYLGQVEPKHSNRLIKLMEGGNKYTAAIVSSTEQVVTVIIREIFQDPSQAGKLSFPPAKEPESFRPYVVGDRIIRREIELEESLPGEHGYTIVGGEEGELLPEEHEVEEEDTEEE